MGQVARALAVASIVAFAGCPSVAARQAIIGCQFNVQDIAVRGYGAFEIELLIKLGVHNPNDIDVLVDTMEYTAYLNGRKLATGRTNDDVTIESGRDGVLPITMRLNLVDVGMAARTLLNGSNRLVKIRAIYYVALPWGRQPFPFEVEHRF